LGRDILDPPRGRTPRIRGGPVAMEGLSDRSTAVWTRLPDRSRETLCRLGHRCRALLRGFLHHGDRRAAHCGAAFRPYLSDCAGERSKCDGAVSRLLLDLFLCSDVPSLLASSWWRTRRSRPPSIDAASGRNFFTFAPSVSTTSLGLVGAGHSDVQPFSGGPASSASGSDCSFLRGVCGTTSVKVSKTRLSTRSSSRMSRLPRPPQTDAVDRRLLEAFGRERTSAVSPVQDRRFRPVRPIVQQAGRSRIEV